MHLNKMFALPAAAFLLMTTQAVGARDLALDVPFVPTPQEVVDAMLEVADVGEDDLLYDLGSGDGRIVVTAAKRYGTRGVGVDVDPERIAEARENAREAGVEDKVRFIQSDLFEVDFSDATVVTMYLLPEVNLKLRERLLELEPGTRLVSHAFDLGEWQPDEELSVEGRNVYHWIVPAQVAGTWQLRSSDGEEYTLKLEQRFQEVKGALHDGEAEIPLQAARVEGEQLRVRFDHPQEGEQEVVARVEGDELVGRLEPEGEEIQAERTQAPAEQLAAGS